jgi:hypothetical protein
MHVRLNIKATISSIFIAVFLFSFFTVLVYAQTLIDYTPTPYATWLPNQRKVFYVGDKWLVFYPSIIGGGRSVYGDALRYAFSSDGVNWNKYVPWDHRQQVVPNGQGYYSQWTVVGASTHYQAVQSNDGDASYIKCTTKDYIDSFVYPDLVNPDTNAYCLYIVVTAKINATGQYGFTLIVRINGVDYENPASTNGTLTTDYQDYYFSWEKNPATGCSWTKDDVNNLELGVKYIMGTGTSGYEIRITYLYVAFIPALQIQTARFPGIVVSGNNVYVSFLWADSLHMAVGVINTSTYVINFTDYLVTVVTPSIKYSHKGSTLVSNKIYFAVNKMRVVLYQNVTSGTGAGSNNLVGDQCGLSGQVWLQYPDNKVDIKDVSYVSRYFGSSSITTDNVMADVYSDKIIDIKDVAAASNRFGNSGTYYNGSAVSGVKVKFDSLSYNITLTEDGWCDVPSNATNYVLYDPTGKTKIYALCMFYVYTVTSILQIYYTNIALDNNGLPLITYSTYNGTHSLVYVIKSSSSSSWQTATGYPKLVSAVTGNIRLAPSILRLANNDFYFIYTDANNVLKGRYYNYASETFSNEEQVTTVPLARTYYHSEVADSNSKVHVVFLTSESNIYNIQYACRVSSNSWTTTTLASSTSSTSAPVISIDTTNDLYVFAATKTTNSPSGWTAEHIYYIKYTASSGQWSSWTDWIDESVTGLTGSDRLTCSYQAYSNSIGLMYMSGTALPYNIRYAYLTIITKTWHDITLWTENALTRKWLNIASFSENLLTRKFYDIALWSFETLTRKWQNISFYILSLLTKSWRDIVTFAVSVLSRMWNAVAFWTFDLFAGLVKLWHDIVYWSTIIGDTIFANSYFKYLAVSSLVFVILFILIFEEGKKK